MPDSKLRVCEAVEDIDDPHNTRVWEVCEVEIARPGTYSGWGRWRDMGTLSTHTTWRAAMDAAWTFARQHA